MAARSPARSAGPKPPFWRDRAKRALIFQTVLIAAVAAFLIYIVGNTQDNLAARGITTGFGFLTNTAGFGIGQSLIEYSSQSTYGRTFLVGLLNTLLVSGFGVLAATLVGFTVGIARLSPNWLIARLANAYIEIFRNIPLLLQIFFWYFAVLRTLPSPRDSISLGEAIFINVRGLFLPEPLFESGFGLIPIAIGAALVASIALIIWNRRRHEATGKRIPAYWISLALMIGVPMLVLVGTGVPVTWEMPELRGFNFRGGITVIPEFLALWLALSIYTASFIAEIVRSGIQAIPHGQTEAAQALSLPRGLVLRLVVIPQALRVIIPPLTSQYLNLIKNSSLATAIGYPDLVSVFAGTTLNQTGQAIEVIAMTMAVYLTISLLVSMFMNWFNARVALVER
ncbi:amino acid ABC transporter permease [Halomonas urumqiensis]|uniref:Amino acid ABC transporter permease n=1 Tax=Halomonas urumqiensis TaxID=1684789 RepID=A0A2N7UNV0_9GAMM|nr:amino acid ABC transporter permease [Halomonas urumqiensis]PMR82099.1 amino acid ABC transporter permease [Halomonas urumqiensis]PTB02570.1 amino acid ABC transporter permease [Halomonas urumqiensis]GHE21048.1 amino acid ABC transporter permease [Halomonas urumqiensis]